MVPSNDYYEPSIGVSHACMHQIKSNNTRLRLIITCNPDHRGRQAIIIRDLIYDVKNTKTGQHALAIYILHNHSRCITVCSVAGDIH